MNNSIGAIIDSITCPIMGDVMTDPVQGNDGQTYERSAIIQALNIKQESPITRQPMNASDLKVNASIRFLCDKYHEGAFGSLTIDRNKPKISNNSIILDHSISINDTNTKLMMAFNVNEKSFPKDMEFGHLSQDIVLIIDHSGSMNCPVEAKDNNGNNLENGMSIQDIVNHSAKTVVKTLDSTSRISIIKFDNIIHVVNDLMLASEMNKTQILSNIDNIKPAGQTNIWSAIEKGIQILDEREDKSRNSAILMLTDGSPNISPARGEVETLKRLRKNKNFTTPIYTFGFGYNLKPELLYDMAKYANGGNGHIPDGNMIATVFCNFIGTILTTVVLNLQLHIVPKENNSVYFDNLLMGDYANIFDSIKEEFIYDIGIVQYQQERNIILNFQEKFNFDYYYTYKIGGQSYTSETKTVNSSFIDSYMRDYKVDIHNYRCTSIKYIREMINYNRINQYEESQKIYHELITLLEKNISPNSKTYIDKLIKNIKGTTSGEGQVKMAISNKYFGRWGEFYLDQLSRSLNQQIKPNFKDEACCFGGAVFESIVDKASDIFDNLVPPTPSLIKTIDNCNYRSLGQIPTPQPRTPIVMSYYNDPNGGCIDSKCMIEMFDGSFKPLSTIKKFDIIKSINNNNNFVGACVKCVFETIITSGKREYVNFNGLSITPWHPIKIGLYGQDEDWFFPGEIFGTYILNSESMITLILEDHHIMFVNNIKCITLGHNFEDNSKLKHAFYGTNNVINNLKTNFPKEFETGKISVNDNNMKHIKLNNITTNIIFSK
jgi:Mg-chelatase subunit ChlD